MLHLVLFAVAALGQDLSPRAYQAPNSTIGISGGLPALMSVRGEAWLTTRLSTELGVGLSVAGTERLLGVDGAEAAPPVFDAALRWRPRWLCVGCGEALMGTVGIGAGTLVTPTLDLRGAWTWSVGADVSGTAIYWFTPTSGIHATARFGAGPEWLGNALGEPEFAWWGFGTLGFAF